MPPASIPAADGSTAPYFSIIVPIYGVQGYLRECLDSILGQSFSDFEVIAVDDRSPDHCGPILDSFAAADSRVHAVHLEENVGLGLARQAALERASGRYVLFLDSDDLLTSDSLASIAERLQATDEPDVLIFDYERTFTTGRRRRNMLHEYLAAVGPDVFVIEARPELLTLLMVVWNKAYKREFIDKIGLRFGPGYYEDTPWTYPALLSARTIATLDQVCVHYRQRRTGNILRDQGRKQFDVFDQYERLFAFLDEHPDLDRWRGFLFGRMISHYLTILTREERIHPRMRREFFARISEHYRRFSPETVARPSGNDGVKWWLIAHKAYWVFTLMLAGSRLLGRVRSSAGAAKLSARRLATRTLKRIRTTYYWFQRRLPLDDHLAVYAAYWFRNCNCNPWAIYDKAREITPDIRGVWVVHKANADRVPPGVTAVHPGSFGYYRAVARAKYLVNNVNFPNEVVKRRGSVYVQTHHGTPLKTMGVDLQAFPVGAGGMSFNALLNRCDRWDYSITSNAFTSEMWDHAYPSFYKTLEVGYPRNDVLFTATPADIEHIRSGLGIRPGQTAVLYAGTHREYHAGFVLLLDIERLARELGPDYVLLVRAHYYYNNNQRQSAPKASVVDVSEHGSIEELYLAADVLITDYSSVMFDYANLDRPIVIHAPDWEVYKSTRGVYFDLFELSPGVITTSDDEIVAAFASGAVSGPEAAAARSRFRKVFCQFDDGHASERVVRRVYLRESLPPPTEPASVLPAAT